MIIILSTGRTGTKFVSNLFKNSCPDLEVRHQQAESRYLNVLGNIASSPRFVNNFSSFLKKIEQNDQLLILDPLQSMYYYSILRSGNYDQSIKIIHLIRDPRDFVTSFMNWKRISLKRSFLHHVFPLWQPNPWISGNASITEWTRMSKFEHFCWVWYHKNQLFADLKSSHDYLLVKFEDLIDPEKGLDTIHELLQHIGSKSIVERNSIMQYRVDSHQKSFPDWKNWSHKQAFILESHCGPLMAKWGYGFEDDWINLLKIESHQSNKT